MDTGAAAGAPSRLDEVDAKARAAAERFGFTFQGIFRKHMVVKAQNRDTAWYSITDARFAREGTGWTS
jgi:RimJ/RimL family protein N-acetyltransferase